ncbi:MAG: silent information regulator protein Sir2 [Planctomycetes bacterium]|nr:silent information regulator protein Sir2 [Planctomycetota bacterium]
MSWKWWSRTKAGSAVRTADEQHSLGHSMCIKHDGPRDWALSSEGRFPAKPGECYLATAWAKVKKGSVELAVVALQKGRTLSWDIGSANTGVGDKWVKIEALAEVPQDCDQVYVRFVGEGDTLAFVDDVGIQPAERPKPVGRPKVEGHAKERVREKLGRGLVATPLPDGKVYLAWRLLHSDPPDMAFDLFCVSDGNLPKKLNERPIAKTTDFLAGAPEAKCAYELRQAGKEGMLAQAAEGGAGHRTIRLDGSHTFQKVGIADLDGDGRYDFVIKQPNTNIDPYGGYWKRSETPYKLEAYDADGKFLWRYDLGPAIETGIWYSPYVVYDFDGDGKAEVAAKTGEGDPRDADGRVQSGPEYLTILDGLTGKPRAQAEWPSREPFVKRPNGYNYASRNQLGVAYLDGKTPCLIVERGTYNLIVVVAYEFHGGKLRELWRWSNEKEPRTYWGQGAHWMHAADVDADGRDELVLGSFVLDDNGAALWSTGLGHPDHLYVGDLDPARPGLEVYFGIEPGGPKNKMCLVDAATGRILWGINKPTRHVHSCGLCSDIDPRHPGAECYSADTDEKKQFAWSLMHTAKGEVIEQDEVKGFGPRTVYWDADPQRELLHSGRLRKFRGGELPPKIEGTFVAVADVLGDWREEIITTLPGEMRIYTTTLPAADRRPCLMQDPLYRLDVAMAAMGYYQVPMLSYDLAARKR